MRRLVACLACRNNGTRLYGKPMQNLDIENRISILQHIIDMLTSIMSINAIVLGIAYGPDNEAFVNIAQKNSIPYIFGSEESVFYRLIRCCRQVNGTDIFRITTESPFTFFEKIDNAWSCHIKNNNDITVLDDRVPEGCHFELLRLSSFEYADRHAKERHKKDFCTLYFKENKEKFKFEVFPVDDIYKRISDIRLTVDNPEDLIVCRAVYEKFKKDAPLIKLENIIDFLDKNAYLKQMVKKYISPVPFWVCE